MISTIRFCESSGKVESASRTAEAMSVLSGSTTLKSSRSRISATGLSSTIGFSPKTMTPARSSLRCFDSIACRATSRLHCFIPSGMLPDRSRRKYAVT